MCRCEQLLKGTFVPPTVCVDACKSFICVHPGIIIATVNKSIEYCIF